jgi:hypothetical protein
VHGFRWWRVEGRTDGDLHAGRDRRLRHTPIAIAERLRARIEAGDAAMQRLLDQHESGEMRPDIFAPWEGADRVITIDTTAVPAVDVLAVVEGELRTLLADEDRA